MIYHCAYDLVHVSPGHVCDIGRFKSAVMIVLALVALTLLSPLQYL